ncbi:MAG: hypothetical protein RLZZ387_5575 [Chloroflexota bacterium]|jgi:hypothetical protein
MAINRTNLPMAPGMERVPLTGLQKQARSVMDTTTIKDISTDDRYLFYDAVREASTASDMPEQHQETLRKALAEKKGESGAVPDLSSATGGIA